MNDTITDLPTKVRAKFFKDDKGRDYIEINIVGDTNSVLRKVTPEDTLRFAREWEAFNAGSGEIEVSGTPLTDVPGIDQSMSLSLRLKGVRTAEELAGLDETAAKALGMGVLTLWQSAKQTLRLRELEAMQALVAQEPKRRGRPPKEADDAEPVV